MRPDPRSDSAPSESSVITKAAIRTAERLAIKNTALAKILGVSEPTISRMRQGKYGLERGQKAFELAVLLVRLYRSLDGIVAGDDRVAADWLKNNNTALDGVPLDLIQSVSGLTDVIAYIDARRAVV
ncbi:MAG TPA: MbcA/ParS/Xre antitoxin family protein [Xanthobacteraceae bacterium]|nr:MbcA/ParS/Xre antitoxin family protein [Xanthobacteraceae bacterium]